MVTRHDVNKVKKASNTAYDEARKDLRKYWLKLPFDKPEACREILLRVVPALVEKHGKVAAVAALQWYTGLREDASGVPAYTPVIPASTPLPQALVRAELGGLWEQDAKKHSEARDRVFDALDSMIERAVKQRSRDTIVYNARRDPAKPRYARVPSGETTCAFCTMLASRGFVYKSDEMAGMTTDFHSKCDCQIVPEFGKGSAHIEGYDPDALYEMYEKARKEAQKELTDAGLARAPNRSEVAQKMRVMFPTDLTDGKGVKRSNYVPRSGIKLLGYSEGIAERWERQQKLKSDMHSLVRDGAAEVLEKHELDFLARFEKLGHRVKWIPKDRQNATSTNDFYWLTNSNEIFELKTTKPKYKTIKRRLDVAQSDAMNNHGVVKENFMIDLDKAKLTSKLRSQLERINERSERLRVRRLWVMSSHGKELEQISLKER